MRSRGDRQPEAAARRRSPGCYRATLPSPRRRSRCRRRRQTSLARVSLARCSPRVDETRGGAGRRAVTGADPHADDGALQGRRHLHEILTDGSAHDAMLAAVTLPRQLNPRSAGCRLFTCSSPTPSGTASVDNSAAGSSRYPGILACRPQPVDSAAGTGGSPRRQLRLPAEAPHAQRGSKAWSRLPKRLLSGPRPAEAASVIRQSCRGAACRARRAPRAARRHRSPRSGAGSSRRLGRACPRRAPAATRQGSAAASRRTR